MQSFFFEDQNVTITGDFPGANVKHVELINFKKQQKVATFNIWLWGDEEQSQLYRSCINFEENIDVR